MVHKRMFLSGQELKWVLKHSLLQPHGDPQQHLQHAPPRHHHGRPPLLHRLHLHDLPVTQTQPQHLRGLPGSIFVPYNLI